jgi:23S rRNA pseudouridine2605 synthase
MRHGAGVPPSVEREFPAVRLQPWRKTLPPPPPRSPKEPQRIAKLLARAGVASRREIERMIGEGRIAIDGQAIEKPATLVTSLRGVTVDGKPVKAPAPARLFRYHKPAGLLTTERDPKGRPTIYDRLPRDLPRVMPVGRLDLNTEGLLLLTTDGELKRQLELPSSQVPRTYRARAFGEVTQDQLEALIAGVEIDGVRYGSIDANMERRTGRNVWIEMRLTEGKNREVRRVLEYLGLQVSRLIRVAYGPFVLGDLPAGAVDEVRQHDLIEFRQALRAGRPFSTPAVERAPSPEAATPARRAPRREDPRPASRSATARPESRPARARGRDRDDPARAGSRRAAEDRPRPRARREEDAPRQGSRPARGRAGSEDGGRSRAGETPRRPGAPAVPGKRPPPPRGPRPSAPRGRKK